MAAVDDMIAEIDAFEPSEDSADNDERLQIWVDRWEETPDKEQAITAMLGLFERYPEITTLGDHGEPGPIVHAIEQIPGYEAELAKSVERMPSYYGVWMVNRILDTERPPEERNAWLDVLRGVAGSNTAAPSVRGTAQEFLGFQGA
jgi:hypothetical protein